MKKCGIAFVVLILIFNLTLNIMYSEEKMASIGLIDLVALANDGEEDADNNFSLVQFQCAIEEQVIVGHYPDGSPEIQTMVYPGELGKCTGSGNGCSPYSCTKFY